MTESRYTTVKKLYLEAFDLEPEERARFLDEAIGDDDGLRREVEQLLGYREDPRKPASAVHAGAASAGRPLPPQPDENPESVGGYRIVRRIGVGGMGAVYEAEQETPRRTVALKVLRHGLATPGARRRFEVESELLGRLQHANIARVYEARHDGDDGPYIAMELVEGRPLDEWVRFDRPARRELLELWARLCDGVEHAHQRGIIHRDLKPGNILVDAEGRPKILDFGIARALDEEHRTTSSRTRFGEVLGTVAYMSPEQASGDPSLIDTRSDVYALGLLGYECLVGHAPLDLRGISFPEAMGRIASAPPARPSSHDTSLTGDLETILLTALDKDRDRRYQSAADLARDIRRFLAHEPIAAHPPSAWYQFRMFARRHRVVMASAMVVVLVVAAGIAGVLKYAFEADRQSARASRESRRAAREAGRAAGEAEAAGRASYSARIRAATAALDEGRWSEAIQLLEATEPARRGWEWEHLRARLDTCELLFGDRVDVLGDVDFTTDGRLVVLQRSGRLRLIPPDGGAETTIDVGSDVTVFAASRVMPEVATGHADGRVRFWDLASGAPRAERRLGEEAIGQLELDRSGRRVYVRIGRRGRLWNRDDDSTVRLRRPVFWAWSPDGEHGVTHGYRFHDADTGYATGLISRSSEPALCGAFSPDGLRLAVGTRHPSIRVLDVESESTAFYVRAPLDAIQEIAWLPDQEHIVSGDRRGTVHLWRLGSDRPVAAFPGHDSVIHELVVSADGKWVAAASADRVRVWRLDVRSGVAVGRNHDSYVYRVAFSPDGGMIASTAWDSTARLWDGLTLRPIGIFASGFRSPTALGWSGDGRRLYVSAPKPWEFDVASGSRLPARRDPEDVSAFVDRIAWPGRFGRPNRTPMKKRAALVGFDGGVLWLRDTHGETVASVPVESVARTAVSRDEAWVAAARRDGVIVILDAASWEPIAELKGHIGPVYDVRFSPDGRRLASGGSDRSLRLWDTTTWTEVALFHGHEGEVRSVVFSDDGTRLATASSDGTVRLWTTRPRHELVRRSGVRSVPQGGLAPPSRDAEAPPPVVETLRMLVEQRAAAAPSPALVPVLSGEPGSGFGTSVAVLERGPGGARDLLLVGAPFSPPRQSGALELWSVESRRRLWRMTGPVAGSRLGGAVVALGDVDGDGVDDFAAGMPGAHGNGIESSGAVVIGSGATGAVLRTIPGSGRGEQCGTRLEALGDLDGDGIAEVVSCPWRRNGRQAVRVLSPRTGEALYTWNFSGHGLPAARALGDRDGDGVADVALVGGDGIRVMSGADGSVLERLPWRKPEPRAILCAVPLESSPTGPTDFAVAVKYRPGSPGQRHVQTLGRPHEPWKKAVPRSRAGRRLHVSGDVDGDGLRDVAVIINETAPDNVEQAASIRILSGKDGRQLHRFDGPPGAARFGGGFALTEEAFYISDPGNRSPAVYAFPRRGN